ncbi:MAG: hypothetical protein IJT46_01050 [Bacteroidaceae bacterium]|nr:hypothetical protein [Bacteroidaceae bacterium]
MKTIYQLQQIAARLRAVTEVNSISPEDTFGLQADVLEYLADMEQNAEGLGIHKVYASYAAMVADASAPVGSNGKALRFGQLVVIYTSANTAQAESGNVYAWQKGNTGAAAWQLMGNLSSVHALQCQIDSLLCALADEEGARSNADSTLQVQIDSLRTSLNTLTSGDVSTAIESFNEIVAFLEGIEDDESLTALLSGLASRLDDAEARFVDLADFVSSGAELPKNGVYLWNGNPVESRIYSMSDGDTYWLAFCLRKGDTNDDGFGIGVSDCLVYSGDSPSDPFYYIGRYYGNAIPSHVQEAFGYKLASADNAGLMSAEDKEKLDNINEELKDIKQSDQSHHPSRFDAIVEGNITFEQVGLASVPALSSVVWCKDMNCFALRTGIAASTKYYNAWNGQDKYTDVDTAEPYTEKQYICGNCVYMYDSSSSKLIEVGGGGAFDISAANNDGGVFAVYASLGAALAAVPIENRKSGMSVRYIDATTNNYEQYRYLSQYANTAAGNNAFINVANWTKGSSGGVYDVSVENAVSGTPATYPDLSGALAAVPSYKRAGGMSIKFICLIPATYTIVKTEGVSEQPTGSELQSDPGVTDGTYTADRLSAFANLPTTSAVTYYVSVTENDATTYTTWVITRATSDLQRYVQYRLMATEWSDDASDWQGVDAKPVAGSDNLVMSGGVIAFDGLLEYSFTSANYENISGRLFIPKGSRVKSIDGPETTVFVYAEDKHTRQKVTIGDVTEMDGSYLRAYNVAGEYTVVFMCPLLAAVYSITGNVISDSEMDDVLGGEVAVYLTDVNGRAVLDDNGNPIEIIG